MLIRIKIGLLLLGLLFLVCCASSVTIVDSSQEEEGVSQDPLTDHFGDTCASSVHSISVGQGYSFVGTTVGRNNDYSSSVLGCGDTLPSSSPDAVFNIKVKGNGVLDIVLVPTTPWLSGFNPTIYLRKNCSTEVACISAVNGFIFYAEDTKPGSYSIIIDGAGGTAGPFNFVVSMYTPYCGDGVLSKGEQCDPGDSVPGDGCCDPGTPKECQFDPSC